VKTEKSPVKIKAESIVNGLINEGKSSSMARRR
jgi:hypothetical protein